MIELMVTVAVLSVLAALAAPSFTPVIERWRVRQVTQDMQATLYLARSEAIKRGGNINLTATSGTDWSTGWSVCAGSCSAASTLQIAAAPSRVTVTIDPAGGTLSIDRWGRISNGTVNNFGFRFVPAGKASTDAAAASLCIRAGGGITLQASPC